MVYEHARISSIVSMQDEESPSELEQNFLDLSLKPVTTNDDDEEVEDDLVILTSTVGDQQKKKKKRKPKKKSANSKKANDEGNNLVRELKDVIFDDSLTGSRLLGGRRDYFRKYGQTFPPSIPVDELFPHGNFPVGDIQTHGKTKYPDPNSSWARLSEEELR